MDLAGDNKTLVSILEGTVGGDAPKTLRVQRYDTAAGKWLPPTLIYELDAGHHRRSPTCRSSKAIASWSSNATTSRATPARAKRVYSIDLDRAVPGKPLQKKLVIDLLSIGNARGLAVTRRRAHRFAFPISPPNPSRCSIASTSSS